MLKALLAPKAHGVVFRTRKKEHREKRSSSASDGDGAQVLGGHEQTDYTKLREAREIYYEKYISQGMGSENAPFPPKE